LKRGKAKQPAKKQDISAGKLQHTPSERRPAPHAAKLLLIRKSSQTGEGAQPEENISGVVAAVVSCATERRSLLEQMREAVKSGDQQLVFRLAKRYCGLVA